VAARALLRRRCSRYLVSACPYIVASRCCVPTLEVAPHITPGPL